MMAWVMSSHKVKGEYHFYIGSVKIAEICFDKNATKWICYLRLMRNSVSYEIKDHYQNMSDALKDLHKLLNSPAPFDTKVSHEIKRTTKP